VVEPETVMLGDKEYPLGRITARRGLTAAALLIPHIPALRPMLEEAAAPQRGKQPSAVLGIKLFMSMVDVLAPVLQPDTFLAVANAVTGIETEILADAPLEDVLAATLKAVKTLNLAEIVKAGMAVFAQAEPPAT